jgi:hypothetical protein
MNKHQVNLVALRLKFVLQNDHHRMKHSASNIRLEGRVLRNEHADLERFFEWLVNPHYFGTKQLTHWLSLNEAAHELGLSPSIVTSMIRSRTINCSSQSEGSELLVEVGRSSTYARTNRQLKQAIRDAREKLEDGRRALELEPRAAYRRGWLDYADTMDRARLEYISHLLEEAERATYDTKECTYFWPPAGTTWSTFEDIEERERYVVASMVYAFLHPGRNRWKAIHKAIERFHGHPLTKTPKALEMAARRLEADCLKQIGVDKDTYNRTVLFGHYRRHKIELLYPPTSCHRIAYFWIQEFPERGRIISKGEEHLLESILRRQVGPRGQEQPWSAWKSTCEITLSEKITLQNNTRDFLKKYPTAESYIAAHPPRGVERDDLKRRNLQTAAWERHTKGDGYLIQTLGNGIILHDEYSRRPDGGFVRHSITGKSVRRQRGESCSTRDSDAPYAAHKARSPGN